MFMGILSALVAGSLVRASSDLQLPEQYIGWPLYKRLTEHESLDSNLLSDPVLSADSSPEMVMNQFESLVSGRQWRTHHDYETAKSFLELNDGQRHCSFDMVVQFLTTYQAYKTTKKTEAHPKVMLKFLEHYGRKKFPLCAREAIAEIRRELVKSTGHNAMPKNFFKLAIPVASRASDSEFYEKLRRFKPLESVFDVDNLVPICERETLDESAAERIERKFDSVCKIVKNFSKMAMNTLNLASHFAPEEEYFQSIPSIGVMNEMRRACLEVEENGTLLEHLKKFCTPRHDSIAPWQLN